MVFQLSYWVAITYQVDISDSLVVHQFAFPQMELDFCQTIALDAKLQPFSTLCYSEKLIKNFNILSLYQPFSYFCWRLVFHFATRKKLCHRKQDRWFDNGFPPIFFFRQFLSCIYVLKLLIINTVWLFVFTFWRSKLCLIISEIVLKQFFIGGHMFSNLFWIHTLEIDENTSFSNRSTLATRSL